MDVRYFGNGTTALVLGDGAARQVDDGRGNVTEVATSRVVVLDPSWIEEVEVEQLLTDRPALHPDTGRPLSDTAPGTGRAGTAPSYDELAAEVAKLRAKNPSYDPTQDLSGSTQVKSNVPVSVTSAAPAITEAPAPATPDSSISEAAAASSATATPAGYTDNWDGTFTRQADGVVGTIDWNAKTFHPQA